MTCILLLLLAPCLIAAPVSAAPHPRHPHFPHTRYRITDLGLASDWQYSFDGIHCLNDRGQILALRYIGRLDGPDDDADAHTFVWRQGYWHDIGDLPQYHNVQGAALNDRGQVVGSIIGPETDHPPPPVEGQGFVGQVNAVQLLPQLPPTNKSQPMAINGGGEVIGSVFRPYIPSLDRHEVAPTRAFLYRRGRMTALGGEGSEAVDINDQGQVVGDDNGRIFLWQNGRSKALGIPGTAVAINDRAQVLIQFNSVQENGDGTPGVQRGRVWRDGGVRDIGTLPGLSLSTVKALNDAGQVVGQASAVGVDRAFLWENGRMRDISRIQPGWTLTEADGINNRGQIVGVGTYRGDEHDFLLTPF